VRLFLVSPSGISCVTADRSFIKINLVLLRKDINKLSSNEKCERDHTLTSVCDDYFDRCTGRISETRQK
jgi:hypothetical protein